jgi:hypothetical protein
MADWGKDVDTASLKTAPEGAIYVAVGQKYVDETIDSARTLKRWMPQLPITLFTSDRVSSPLIDQVVPITTPNASFEDKILAMRCSPYEKTIYLDSDTYLCDTIDEVFRVLDHYDLWAVFDPAQRDPTGLKTAAPEAGHDLPPSIIEHNCGVLGFRKSQVMIEFFDVWYAAFLRGLAHGLTNDQVTFRKCMYESRVRAVTLPSEYNFRTVLAGMAFAKVRLLHGRGNLEALERKLNRSVNAARFSVPGIGILSKRNPLFKALNVLRQLPRMISRR